ncbi:MAG: hypothetical protein LBP69_00855 [Treponema sp.]|jgi:hypothetical protein|nr:hypothetical protein [Treponema sp.]
MCSKRFFCFLASVILTVAVYSQDKRYQDELVNTIVDIYSGMLRQNTYLAFNGKSYIGFDIIAVQPPNIEDLPGFVNRKVHFPNTFTLVYAKADDSKNVEKEYHFVFNGKEFEGDYSILGR